MEDERERERKRERERERVRERERERDVCTTCMLSLLSQAHMVRSPRPAAQVSFLLRFY